MHLSVPVLGGHLEKAQERLSWKTCLTWVLNTEGSWAGWRKGPERRVGLGNCSDAAWPAWELRRGGGGAGGQKPDLRGVGTV